MSTHPVTTPMIICDAFAEERFHGNQAGVCLVPMSTYCAEWSEVSSLEASVGRGEPEREDKKETEEQRQAKDEKYRAERHKKMGVAFQDVATEMGFSETAFVYRLPAARIKKYQELIRSKANEIELEIEKEREEEEMRCNSVPQMDIDDDLVGGRSKSIVSQLDESAPGLIPSDSFIANSGGLGMSFLQTRSASVFSTSADSVTGRKKARRAHVQFFGLRWFTPETEMPMCGHATFAAAHALFEMANLAHNEHTRHIVENVPPEFFVPAQTDVIYFATVSGIISVRQRRVEDTGFSLLSRDITNTPRSYEVHFPSTEATSVKDVFPPAVIARLVAALGLPYGEDACDDVCLNMDNGYYALTLNSPRYVFQCKPTIVDLLAAFDVPEFEEALKQHQTKLVRPRALIVTAENNDDIEVGLGSDAEIISRFFAPWLGVLEDPVTGSMHCTIVPYWLRRRQEGKFTVGDRLHCYQASKRGGYMTAIMIGHHSERVALIGSCITFMRGNCTFNVLD